MPTNHLFFWHFFERLEKELSYERWIDKYRLFMATVMQGGVAFDDDWASFKRFCKILYLQDIQHESRFDEILNEAIKEEEEAVLIQLLEKAKPVEKALPSTTDKEEGAEKTPPPQMTPPPEEKPPKTIKEEKKEPELIEKYFKPKFKEQNTEGVAESEGKPKEGSKKERFVHSDEYYPMTRRDMTKSWQYLRKKERKGLENIMDIPATVKSVAKNGLFLNPVFKYRYVNRADTVLILADCRGSMMPFHELTRRFITTARKDGGHENAAIYYFQNYPLSNVYRQANLSDAIKLKEALIKANRHLTLAIIISDAGAAKGNTDSKIVAKRVELTKNFITILNDHVAHILWLNPMPEHRWQGTAAEQIKDMVDAMMPILEGDEAHFQDNFRLILKKYRAK